MVAEKNSPKLTPENIDDAKDLFAKGRDFLQMYNKVVQFTQELINRNLELRNKIKELEQEKQKL